MDVPTWDQIGRKCVDRLADQGPTVIVLVIMLAAAGFMFWKIIWPFLTKTVTNALGEAKASREQRAFELEADKQDKGEMHKTARIIAGEVHGFGGKLEEHGRRIDGLSVEVRSLPERMRRGTG